MTKLFDENRELIKVTTIAVVGFVVAVAIIVLAVVLNNKPAESYYDEYSEEEISLIMTGGGYNAAKVNMVGFGLLSDDNLATGEIVLNMIKEIRNFITLTYPNVTRISVVKKSIEKDDDTISFKIHTDTDGDFLCKLKDYGNSLHALAISDGNNVILEYDTAEMSIGARSPKILAKKYLPHNIRQDDLAITVIEDYDEIMQILVSSCGDEEIKMNARAIVDDWLKTLNFDPKDFDFEIPTYCDGGV